MNGLLWRAEFSSSQSGYQVPPKMVWEKVITAIDNSFLIIRQGKEEIGYCRWTVNSKAGMAVNEMASDTYRPDETPTEVEQYTVDVETSIDNVFQDQNLKAKLNIVFSGDRAWEEFELRINIPPAGFLLARGKAGDEKIEVRFQMGSVQWSRKLTIEQLLNPENIFNQMLPIPGNDSLKSLNPSRLKQTAGQLQWRARQDWVEIGGTRARVYRLETTSQEQYKITVLVSRAGEILKAQLPGGLTMVNRAFTNW
ncbi:MAG: hypothetical protein K9N48_05195 [Verrucomicrobia bacterium]|nr:hypothetical protein [Verrucomicrobiota bacterium]